MADILLKCDSNLSATYVPNTFIDKYMTHADGEFVKIYLYLLRCMNRPDTPFSISGIADKFEYTEKDVTRALKYWEKVHLLRLEFNQKDELTGICLTDSVSPAASLIAAESSVSDHASEQSDKDHSVTMITVGSVKTDLPDQEPSAAFENELPQRMEYSSDQLLQFHEDETVQELLYVAERYLGHQLNYTETQTVLYWLDKLGFSQDLIDFLVEQCVAKHHPAIQYMDKIALNWASKGIHTLKEAKDYFSEHSKTVHAVRKAFGISERSLADFEQDYVNKWSGEMGFSDDIIVLACQKTLRCTQKISFEYANSILESWQQQNIHTVTEVELLDADFKKTQIKKYAAKKTVMRNTRDVAINTYTSFPQRTYDYDALERELLSR